MYKRVKGDIAKSQFVIIPTFGFAKNYYGYYLSFMFLCFRLAIMIKKR